jgi:anti-sigma factor RsiW
MSADCRRTIDRLTSYVDRSLSPAEHADVGRHLDACPPCRRIAERERGGHLLLRHHAAQLRTTPLPPGLRTRCEALARTRAAAVSWLGLRGFVTDWRFSLVPTLLGLFFLVFTVTAVIALATRHSDTLLAAQLTADHSKCFLLSDRGASTTDAASVERMLAQQYGWQVHIPPSSAEAGVQLIGARRCLYADGLIPHVMYHANGEDVSLYVLDGVTRKSSDVVALGHRSRIWTRNEKTYVLVSSALGEGLPDVARYMMNEAH